MCESLPTSQAQSIKSNMITLNETERIYFSTNCTFLDMKINVFQQDMFLVLGTNNNYDRQRNKETNT